MCRGDFNERERRSIDRQLRESPELPNPPVTRTKTLHFVQALGRFAFSFEHPNVRGFGNSGIRQFVSTTCHAQSLRLLSPPCQIGPPPCYSISTACS